MTAVTVPTSTVERVVAALRSDGRIKRGYLGVSTQQVQLPGEERSGLLVVHTDSEGPAAQVGLHLGDTLIGFGEVAISDHADLLAELAGDRIDSSWPVTQVARGRAGYVRGCGRRAATAALGQPRDGRGWRVGATGCRWWRAAPRTGGRTRDRRVARQLAAAHSC